MAKHWNGGRLEDMGYEDGVTDSAQTLHPFAGLTSCPHSGVPVLPRLTERDGAPLVAIATSFAARKAQALQCDVRGSQGTELTQACLTPANRPTRAPPSSRSQLWGQCLHAEAGQSHVGACLVLQSDTFWVLLIGLKKH